jgi:precorrin-6x reductase
MSYEEKRARLQANRAALMQQHAALTEQIAQTTVGIHQIDGALQILGELEAEAARLIVDASHPNGVATVAADA